MTWKDGGNYGLLCREITDEAGDCAICTVWTKQLSGRFRDTEPWPEGEENFALILKAPELAYALHELLWGVVGLLDKINRCDPELPEYLETDSIPECQRARELLAQFGVTGPPKGENDV